MSAANLPPVFILAVGSYGDLFPYLRLAQAFLQRGHVVTFIASSYHRQLVEQAGLPFVGLGNDEDYLRILRNPDLWNARKGFALLASFYPALMQEIIATLTRLNCDPASWLLCHPLALPAAAILQEQGQVGKIASAFLAPSNLPSCYGRLQFEEWRVPDWLGPGWRKLLWRLIARHFIDKPAVGRINQVRLAHGLAPVQSYFSHMLSTPSAALCLFPAWFGRLQPDWPKNLIQADFPLFDGAACTPLSPELQQFLAAGSRPLIFTPGTGHQHAQKFFQLASELVQANSWRAIFLSKERAQIPVNLPANILWQAYVPLASLLPHAALLVHHGGIGTSAEAMRAGVPQLITPYAWDQFDNGGRMQEMGIARSIAAKRLKLTTLDAAIQHLLLAPEVRLACQRVAAEFQHSQSATSMCVQLSQALSASAGAVVQRK